MLRNTIHIPLTAHKLRHPLFSDTPSWRDRHWRISEWCFEVGKVGTPGKKHKKKHTLTWKNAKYPETCAKEKNKTCFSVKPEEVGCSDGLWVLQFQSCSGVPVPFPNIFLSKDGTMPNPYVSQDPHPGTSDHAVPGRSTMDPTWVRKSTGNAPPFWFYHLVNIQKAMENGHL